MEHFSEAGGESKVALDPAESGGLLGLPASLETQTGFTAGDTDRIYSWGTQTGFTVGGYRQDTQLGDTDRIHSWGTQTGYTVGDTDRIHSWGTQTGYTVGDTDRIHSWGHRQDT